MTTKEITLPVTGMTCAMCQKNIERSLKRADGVADVSVNLATEKANVHYDGDKLAASDLVAQVERAGYGVAAAAIDLPITGMTCAMCQKNVERALNRSDGVISASVNLASEKASVSYLPRRERAATNLVEAARARAVTASSMQPSTTPMKTTKRNSAKPKSTAKLAWSKSAPSSPSPLAHP